MVKEVVYTGVGTHQKAWDQFFLTKLPSSVSHKALVPVHI